MKREILLIMLLLSVLILLAGGAEKKEISRIKGRADLIWGYGVGDDAAEVKETAKRELAKAISDWYLTKRGIANKINYGKRDQYEQMVEVWQDSFSADLHYLGTGEKEFEGIYYISQSRCAELYKTKKEQLQTLINRGEKALELNKIGLYFRNFYWALVELDLLAGEDVTIGEKNWTSENLIEMINRVAENFAIKIAGNRYEAGNRRLIMQVLYDRRPVNDLRLGILVGDSYQYYSVTDRYLQVDIFGFEYADQENITFSIDVQDKSTKVWGDEVARLGFITGMNGFEAYRTIPLREVEFEETGWQAVNFPIAEEGSGYELLAANLRNLVESIEKNNIAETGIFSNPAVMEEFSRLQTIMQLKNLVLGTRIKSYETAEGIMWRGFDVEIVFAGGLTTITNLVVKTDSEHKISGVWLGMKPIDFRLLSRNYGEGGELEKFLAITEKIERQYTEAVCGMGGEIEGFPVYPAAGWDWAEIEDISIEVLENGVVYNFRLTLSGEEQSWEFELKGIEGE